MTCVAIQWDRPRTETAAESAVPSLFERGRAGGFADTTAARVGRAAGGAADTDMLLDSPNSLQTQLSALRSRGFERLNDPRRRR